MLLDLADTNYREALGVTVKDLLSEKRMAITADRQRVALLTKDPMVSSRP